jgi:hypothetical protein
MPYKAAKAVAATFCYNIRHALTPLFGKEFLSMCTHPKNPNYAKFLIESAIVRECTEETNRWRLEGVTYKPSPVEQHFTIITSPKPRTPQMRFAYPVWEVKASKSQQAKQPDQESGYGTDGDANEKYMFSPEISPRSQTWTSVNRSQSPSSLSTFSPPQPWLTSVPEAFGNEHLHTKRLLSKVTYGADNEQDSYPGPIAPATLDMDFEPEGDYGDGYHSKKELGAAEILLNLSAADSTLHRTKRTRRGSRYQ